MERDESRQVTKPPGTYRLRTLLVEPLVKRLELRRPSLDELYLGLCLDQALVFDFQHCAQLPDFGFSTLRSRSAPFSVGELTREDLHLLLELLGYPCVLLLGLGARLDCRGRPAFGESTEALDLALPGEGKVKSCVSDGVSGAILRLQNSRCEKKRGDIRMALTQTYTTLHYTTIR